MLALKKILIGIIFSTTITYTSAQNRADRQSLSQPNSSSIILMGDPQGYGKYDINQPIFDLTTAWIADNIENLNIKAVLCTGDLVEQNENMVLNRKMLNQTSKQMWEASSKAFERLDHKIPYINSLGNHDYGFKNAENGSTHYPDYFPIERNSTWKKSCISAYPNRDNRASLENAVFEINVDNWKPLLVISLEYHPRDEVLEWCKKTIATQAYKDHHVIILTHSFLTNGQKASRIVNANVPNLSGNTGEEIWTKLIKPSTNIKLVICGHTANGNGKFEDNVSYIVENNDSNKPVHQMMFNVQTLGGGWEGNGGDGWLRILEFIPDGKTVKISTYSPLFGISPSTKHLAHRTEAYDKFDIIFP